MAATKSMFAIPTLALDRARARGGFQIRQFFFPRHTRSRFATLFQDTHVLDSGTHTICLDSLIRPKTCVSWNGRARLEVDQTIAIPAARADPDFASWSCRSLHRRFTDLSKGRNLTWESTIPLIDVSCSCFRSILEMRNRRIWPVARDNHSDLSRLRKFWYLPALCVVPGCEIALRFSIGGREKDMSKSGWLRQAGAWTWRTSTRPFRTGSWKKRLTLVLATTTATGGLSAAGYRYLHDCYTQSVASSDVHGLERSPLPSVNRNPVVPLNVDEEKPASLPVPPVEMQSSRRNPAARHSSKSGADVANDTPTGRSRFEGLPENPIRPVSDEQPAETGNSRNASTLPRLPRTASRFGVPLEQEHPESDRSEPSNLRNTAPANDEIPVDDSVAGDEPNTSPDDMTYDEEPKIGRAHV